MLSALSVCVVAFLFLSCSADLCDVAGNWTSLPVTSPAVHIEITQDEHGGLIVQATPWGGAKQPGHVNNDSTVTVDFYGGGPAVSKITASEYPEFGTNNPAPPCTFMYNWCKFPYCPIKEPVWPPFPVPSCTCALSGSPCPPPKWAPEWNLTRSTVCQPGGPDVFSVPPSEPWGLVSLDWSVGENVWLASDRRNSTCEATSVANCRALKASGAATRCFIYHNMELALEWIESQRAVMYDPTKADYFLQYTDGMGHKNGTIYNEARDEGDQYFWDYTNPEAAQYYVDSVLQAVSDPAVDGTFTDDVTGVPAEHPEVQSRVNMTDAQLAALQEATQNTSQNLINALISAGKYNWQAFGAQDGVNSGPSANGCADWMRRYCDPAYQSYPMLLGLSSDVNQTVAAFLITRPPVAFLGWGWESDQRQWTSIFLLQPGEPLGLCTETSSGVFSRQWTAATAVLDCNTWTASLPFPSL